MDILFSDPGVEYNVQKILSFQSEAETAFWSNPLYHFYPGLDREYSLSLPFSERKQYIEDFLRSTYPRLRETVSQKIPLYADYWDIHKAQVEDALSDAFETDCRFLFNDLQCHVTLNPIMPRFLKTRSFDIFYLASERGALGLALHELVHFVWFHVWNSLFGDTYAEYERPSMKWILSEMVVETIMSDPRLSSINPYFPRENGGCVYPYFFDMKIGEANILDTLAQMHREQSIAEFMRSSYAYCLANEHEIRQQILAAER